MSLKSPPSAGDGVGSGAPQTMRRAAASGAMWTAAARLIDQLVVTAVFISLARILGPSDFGLIALSGATTAFMALFVESGYQSALIQRSDLDPRDGSTVFWTNVVMGAVLTLTLVGLAPGIADRLDEPMLSPLLTALSLLFSINAMSVVPQAMLTRELDFRALAVRQNISNVAGGIAAVVAAFAGLGVWSLVVQQYVSRVLACVLVWFATPWRPTLAFSWERLKLLTKFGSGVLGSGLTGYAHQYVDRFIIASQVGSAMVGQFSVATRLNSFFVMFVGGVVSRVTLPTLARIQDDRERLERAFLRSVRLTSFATFPLFGSLVVVGPSLVETLAGAGYSDAGRAIRFLSIAGVVASISQFNAPVLLAAGRSMVAFGLTAASSATHLIAVAIGVFLLPRYFPDESMSVLVAACIGVRTVVWAPIPPLILSRGLGFSVRSYAGTVRAPVVASAILIASLAGVWWAVAGRFPAFVELAVYGTVGALVYWAAATRVTRASAVAVVADLESVFPSARHLRRLL